MKNMFFRSIIVVLIIGALVSCGGATKPIDVNEYIAMGEKYLTEMKYEEAYTYFLEVIEVEPMNVRAYLGITDAQIHLGKQEESVEVLNKGYELTGNEILLDIVVAVEKSDIEGYISLAEAYIAEGLSDKAKELLERVYYETGDPIIGAKLGIVNAIEIEFKEDYLIEWADKTFETHIRELINKPMGDIYYFDVKDIEIINIWGDKLIGDDTLISYSGNNFTFDNMSGTKNGEIKNLEDLRHFSSLTNLSINFQVELDINALGMVDEIDCLQRLENLSLISNNIENIEPISKLYNLHWLTLSYNNIKDVSPLSLMIELESLSIVNNKNIESMQPLIGLKKLTSVSLSQIENIDLSVFEYCPNLVSLNLVSNQNVNYEKLLDFHTLRYLEISLNENSRHIVQQMNFLDTLRIHGRGINMEGIDNLTNLSRLEIAGTVDNLTFFENLNIEELKLFLPQEQDCDLTPISKLKNLKVIYIQNSYSSDVANEQLNELKIMMPNVEFQ